MNKYESTESLIINDSLNEYFGQKNPMDSKKKLLEQANRKGKDGLLIIADMGPYFFKMNLDKLLNSSYLYHHMPLLSKDEIQFLKGQMQVSQSYECN